MATSDELLNAIQSCEQELETTATVLRNSAEQIGNAVHKSGNETIAGTKTFSASPDIPTPAAGDNTTKAASTAFVGTAVSAHNSDANAHAALKSDAVDSTSSATVATSKAVKTAYDAAVTTMTGATSSAAGTAGRVPAPTAAVWDKYLRGDGRWASIMDARDSMTHTDLVDLSDLNDFVKPGAYYISGSRSFANMPPASNGLLLVYTMIGNFVRQVFYRIGTTNVNKHHVFTRQKAGNTWSTWKQFCLMVPVDDVLAYTDNFTIYNRGIRIFINREVNDTVSSNIYPGSFVYGRVDGNFSEGVSHRIGAVFAGISSNIAHMSILRVYSFTPADNNENQLSLNLCFLKTGVKYADINADFRPTVTNAYKLGAGSYYWSDVYATTGHIGSSDERIKTSITVIPDAVLDAWGKVQWQQYQMIDAVEKKGSDAARIHMGAIAQRIDAVFKAHGLDASRYGLFCHDTWDAEDWDEKIVDKEAVTDEQGNVIEPEVSHTEHHHRDAGDMYALRYGECLCLEAAYQRRRADRMEAQLQAQAADIAAIKAKLG